MKRITATEALRRANDKKYWAKKNKHFNEIIDRHYFQPLRELITDRLIDILKKMGKKK